MSNIRIAEVWNFCHFCVQNEWKIVRWWHHQLTHLHIHIDWSRNVSWKFAETSECHTHSFLIFQPIFIRFSLFCSKFFTLSSEIKLNLLWISSLRFTIQLNPYLFPSCLADLYNIVSNQYQCNHMTRECWSYSPHLSMCCNYPLGILTMHNVVFLSFSSFFVCFSLYT